MAATFGPRLEEANLTSSGVVLVEEIMYFMELRYLSPPLLFNHMQL